MSATGFPRHKSDLDVDKLKKDFENERERHPDAAFAVTAINVLTTVIEQSKESTYIGLSGVVNEAVKSIKKMRESSISLSAGCDLFLRYITRTSKLDTKDFKQKLIARGRAFAESSADSRGRIARYGDRFIQDRSKILVHGESRVVLQLLKAAKEKGKNFSVIVTQGPAGPNGIGRKVALSLNRAKIPCSIIPDAAVAATMESVDMILVGAEGVVESGGVINRIGTYQIAMIASMLNTPFYVAAESYKFTRIFPLSQKDVQKSYEKQEEGKREVPYPRGGGIQRSKEQLPSGVKRIDPEADYTPPKFITLLFTDLGILTPSAVSDELIKLYS